MERANVKSDDSSNSWRTEKIQKVKQGILKGVVWFFVGSVILTIILILAGSNDAVSRMLGTVFTLAFLLIFSAIELERLYSEYKSAQAFAAIGIISNLATMIFSTLIIWGVTPMTDIAARVLTIFSTFAGLGFFGCLTMGIKEYDKRQTIMPLKITAAICLIYTEIFSLFVTLNVINEYDKSIERFGILAGFAGLIWFTAAIIAFFISRGVRKRKIEAANKALIEKGRAVMEEKDTSEKSKTPKTDAELRAEIEEKVRREMIEKEVRERIAKEMSEKK